MLSRVFLTAAALTATLAQAQPQPGNPQLFTSVQPAQMGPILKSMGLEFTDKQTSEGHAFAFELGGYKVTLLDLGNDMQLYVGFTNKLSLEKVNEWNGSYRFCRSYVDKKGEPYLESDLSFDGGVTAATIQAFIRQYEGTLATYSKFLIDSEKGSTTSTAPQSSGYNKSAAAQTRLKTPAGDFAVWIDPAKWKTETSDDPSVLKFRSVTGDAYARAITERLKISTAKLREIALINVKKADPKAKVVFEQRRVVNGKELLAMQISGVVNGIPIRYYGYYHGGTSGTVQFVVFTDEGSFDAAQPALTDFLNGLEIADDEAPEAPAPVSGEARPGFLPFNAGKMSLTYDPAKWKQQASDKGNHFELTHVSGDGYAMIIAERLTVPTDALPDIALSNAREADPNAKIVFREKRKVNGIDVWFLKMEANVNSIPLIYYGYYYGGESGTVQLLTYTGRSLLKDFESDFMELLNGLRVTQP